MVDTTPELRAKLKELAREFMAASMARKLEISESVCEELRQAGIEDEAAVEFWFAICREIIDEKLLEVAAITGGSGGKIPEAY